MVVDLSQDNSLHQNRLVESLMISFKIKNSLAINLGVEAEPSKRRSPELPLFVPLIWVA